MHARLDVRRDMSWDRIPRSIHLRIGRISILHSMDVEQKFSLLLVS